MRLLHWVPLLYFLAYVTHVEGKGHGGCSRQPARGNCSIRDRKWYYDTQKKTCNIMLLGTCPGKFNSYPSCEACLRRCDLYTRSKNMKKNRDKKENSVLKLNRNRNRCIMKA
uniref:Pancreatic trypsin inhibitor n=1 Tax=Rhipicephalus zambeziensis TaxID=60191 RepID=A0A224YBV8_9ACAR